jgi:hypothetical protein
VGAETVARLARDGLEIGPLEHPAGPDGPHTAFVSDPDGYRIELVQLATGAPGRDHRSRLPSRTARTVRRGDTVNQPIRLYMSMSLDGYIAGPDDRSGQELGAGGGRLFNWLDDRLAPGVNGQVYSELMATGAVMSGRRTFELAGRCGRRPPRRRTDPRAHPPHRGRRRPAGQHDIPH